MQDKLFTRDFLLLTAAHFLQALGFSSMLLLPLYLDFLEASRAEIGGVMAAAAVGGLIVRPLIAWSLDHFGRKKSLIAGTLVITLGLGLIYGIDAVDPYAYGVRIVFGVGSGFCFSGYFAFAADHIPASRRTEGLALFGVSGLVPLIVNPLSGFLVSNPADVRWFIPLVGCLVGASLIPLLGVREVTTQASRTPWRVHEVLGSLKATPLLPVWFATLAFSSLVAIFFAFSTVTATSRGVEKPTHLWYLYALGAAVVRIAGAKAPDRLGPQNLVAPALASYIGSALIASTGTSNADFLLAGLLAGIGHGICFPVLTSQVVTRTPTHHRGSGLAMFTALWAISGLTIPPLFGTIADHHGEDGMFLLAALCTTTLLAFWLILEHTWGAPRRTEIGRLESA